MRNWTHFYLAASVLLVFFDCTELTRHRNDADVVKSVADKIIKETVFGTTHVLQEPALGVQCMDYKSQYGAAATGIGYAFSHLVSKEERDVILGLSSSGRIKIWVNGRIVFEYKERRISRIAEIAYNKIVIQDSLRIRLRRGMNTVLVKSASQDDEWIVLLRAMNTEGEEDTDVHFTLSPLISNATSNWLIVGPFPDTYHPECSPEAAFKEYYSYDGKQLGRSVPGRCILSELEIPPSNTFQRDSCLDWNYANGATMLGMLAVADHLREPRYLDFVREYCDFIINHLDLFRRQYEKLHALRGSYHRIFRRAMLGDTGAPALPFAELQGRAANKLFANIVDSVSDYILHEQKRLEDGTFCRSEPVSYTLWADDLFMSIPFLLRMATIKPDINMYHDECVSQILRFYEYLYDPGTGVLFHGWFSPSRKPSEVRWGRANGWAVWAVSEALMFLPREHPEYGEVLHAFRNHIDGLSRYQDKEGMWHQVLDEPESFEETSCTAMFVLAMARGLRYHWIKDSYRDQVMNGWQAVLRMIDRDGTVRGICQGTGIGNDLEFYLSRETFDHDPRGLGAVLTAGVEILKLMSMK